MYGLKRVSWFLRRLTVLGLLGTSPALAGTPFTEGMVSITLDDGWATQYKNARPALNQRGLRATYYIPSDPIRYNWNYYMTALEVQSLVNEGNEVGSHTVNHPDLTTLSPFEVDAQLRDSQAWLQSQFGLGSVASFASPYGKYTDSVLSNTQQYYGSHRTVEGGHNFRDSNVLKLRAHDVTSNVTVDTVRGWIDAAVQDQTWLILVFHDFVNGTPLKADQLSINDFKAILDHVKASGVRTVSVSEGVALMDGVTTDPSGYAVVHEDGLGSGFQDWGWATRNLTAHDFVQSGLSSISFEPDSWSGLFFHRDIALDASLHQSLELWVHGGSSGGQLINLKFQDGSTLIGSVRLDQVLGHPIQAGIWQRVSVPLSSVNLSTGTIRDIYIQDASGGNQGTLYIDDIRLIRR